MKIIADAFGGDNAPLEILKGCETAVRELGVTILLTGDEAKIRACAQENGISLDRMEILHAPDVMGMEDAPTSIAKEKGDTSMAVGLKALAEGRGDAFVSAGSTGALVVGATLIVKRIRGVRRAAIASVLPSNKAPFLLMDCGANVECTAQMLDQFGAMGSFYMQKVLGVERPRVGLANIGTEKTKGGPLQLEAYELMETSDYHFIGNVEARDVPFGACDVLVADGFTGNMLLKMYEGVAGAMMVNIKAIFKKNLLTKLSALMIKNGLMDFKKRMDYTEFGGAPLLGISKPVIKAHGSSNAKAFCSAIRQAKQFSETGVIENIANAVSKTNQDTKA